MHARKSLLLLAVALVLVIAASAVYAASNATITFLDGLAQPDYQADAETTTDDGGCDVVSMLMTDATGTITDIDTFCLDLGTGIGSDSTDWGSYESGYYPVQGPLTYALFDTAPGSACDNENSFDCGAYLMSGAVACIGENYYDLQSESLGAIVATPYHICSAPAVSASCPIALPSGSVVYSVPNGAPTYYAASLDTLTTFSLPAGTWYVSEFSGDFAKVWIACQANMVWIPTSAVSR